MAEDFRLPSLFKVFHRYPQLTLAQCEEICRRRVERTIMDSPFEITDKYDTRFAIGYLTSAPKVDTRVFVKKD